MPLPDIFYFPFPKFLIFAFKKTIVDVMRKTIYIIILNCVLPFFLVLPQSLEAQTQTVGLFENKEESFNGYTLFAPMRYPETYLIDNCGRVVHFWENSFLQGNSVYLLPDGSLLRMESDGVLSNPDFFVGGGGDHVQLYDWEGNILWTFTYSDDKVRMHHDIAPLPNGNVLILAWEKIGLEEVIASGRNPEMINDDELWPEHIIEVEPVFPEGGNIVWEWHLWDHLIQDFDPSKKNYGNPQEHPELLDINYTGDEVGVDDWIHANAIDYNVELDQILLNGFRMGEIYIIDHSTTSEEAAGHSGGKQGRGGDFLYRWGNPVVYRQGDTTDQKLYGHHNPHWIGEGMPDENKIMIFNNGRERPEGLYSSVVVIENIADETGAYSKTENSPFLPDAIHKEFQQIGGENFFAPIVSSAQQLPNGNVLICDGPKGRIVEIKETDHSIVWDYINPATMTGIMSQGDTLPPGPSGSSGNLMFRAIRYAPDYPAFQNKELSPGEPLELNPTLSDCMIYTDLEYKEANTKETETWQVFPNPAQNEIFIETKNKTTDQRRTIQVVRAYNLTGQLVLEKNLAGSFFSHRLNIESLTRGLYVLKVEGDKGRTDFFKLVVK